MLRAGVPIATDIDAIDENNALSPILHIDKRIAGIGQVEGSLVENRLIPQRRYLGRAILIDIRFAGDQSRHPVHRELVHLPVRYLAAVNLDRADDPLRIAYDLLAIIDTPHVLHQDVQGSVERDIDFHRILVEATV